MASRVKPPTLKSMGNAFRYAPEQSFLFNPAQPSELEIAKQAAIKDVMLKETVDANSRQSMT